MRILKLIWRRIRYGRCVNHGRIAVTMWMGHTPFCEECVEWKRKILDDCAKRDPATCLGMTLQHGDFYKGL